MNAFTIAGGVLGIGLIVAGAFALNGDSPKHHTHDGVVVSSTNSQLIMTDDDGTESTHLVTSKTRVTRDGSACEASDLNFGTRIRVTTQDSREGTAIEIEALEKNADSAG